MTRRGRTLSVIALAVALAGLALLAGAWREAPRWMQERYHRVMAERLPDGFEARLAAVEVDWRARRYRLRGVDLRQDGTSLVTVARVDVLLRPLARTARVAVAGARLRLQSPGRVGGGVPWRGLLDELAPGLRIERIDFDDTALEFRRAAEPSLVVTLDNLHGALAGLDAGQATLEADGLLMAHAPLRVQATFDPDGPVDALRLRARAHELELPRLNAFAQRWARLDFNRGEAELVLALAYSPPRVHGAAGASLAGVDVFDLQQDLGRGRNLLAAVHELFAGATVAGMKGEDGRIEREFAIDASVPPEGDNLASLRAVIDAAVTDLGRYLP